MAKEKMGQGPETVESPQETGKDVLLLTPEQEKQVEKDLKAIEKDVQDAAKKVEKQAA